MRHLSVVLLCFAVGCGATNPNHGAGGGGGGTGGGGTGGTGGGSGGGGTGGTGGGGGTGGDGCTRRGQADLRHRSGRHLLQLQARPDEHRQLGIHRPRQALVQRRQRPLPAVLDVGRPQRHRVGRVRRPVQPRLGTTSCSRCRRRCRLHRATSFMGDQMGFKEFGMGFVSNSSGSTDETLFIAGGGAVGSAPTPRHARHDDAHHHARAAPTGNPELTGTGLGELWGFFPDLTAGAEPGARREARQDDGAQSRRRSRSAARPARPTRGPSPSTAATSSCSSPSRTAQRRSSTTS